MAAPLGLTFSRYRKRKARILEIYEIFVDSPKRLLHPIEISRQCGLHMLDVIEILESAPEIFLRLPSSRQSVTKYGLRPSVAIQSQDEIEQFINRRAKNETYLLYAVISIVVLALLVVALSSVPYLISLFHGSEQPPP